MRICEAYVGEYASGKSENAVARAIGLAEAGHAVTLVDLDLVEPCYTLRSLIDPLAARGVTVLAWRPEETFGLGEAGQILLPAARWALRRAGDIIFDVGYGVGGTAILNLIEGIADEPDFRIIMIANFARPQLATPELLRQYIEDLGGVDGLIANTHLGEETNPALVLDGFHKTARVAKELGISLDALALSREFADAYPEFLARLPEETGGCPIRIFERILPQGFW